LFTDTESITSIIDRIAPSWCQYSRFASLSGITKAEQIHILQHKLPPCERICKCCFIENHVLIIYPISARGGLYIERKKERADLVTVFPASLLHLNSSLSIIPIPCSSGSVLGSDHSEYTYFTLYLLICKFEVKFKQY